MRAVVFRRYGGPEVLEWGQVETPDAGPGEVRVRVRAAGVQPIDCAVRAGFTPVWLKPKLPAVPGNEFAGVVDQVGAGVAGIVVGDEVLGFGFMNAAAEFVVVPADQVTAKPAGMEWEVAAGAVGAVAVQLAVSSGVRVVGTASAANQDYLRSLGAVPVDYRQDLSDQLSVLLPDGAGAVPPRTCARPTASPDSPPAMRRATCGF
ncbi:alcohol dehydrogenase catalytic domain-containing protein [Micromonospora sp. NBC_01813]|nr:alcohol dehydrogenase catalytic domain-containing protein [Micromonospora sp. NBC_01813]WSA06286.1 alcohol dehydrogenase catalytic domain-containing protein [Micromonospora sp. NBC_01813]